MKKNLLEMLIKNSIGDVYPFHMPGHKRNNSYMGNELPYRLDITEIDGFDDLHHPEGVLDRLNKRVSTIFSSDESCCLINGSTVGNLAAILGTTKPGDKVLVARNSHISIHNAITLNNLQAGYLYPKKLDKHGIHGEVNINELKLVLKAHNYDIKAVVIVSPTYDGVISDVKAIADEVHKYGIPLIVDEAHGAHLGLGDYWTLNSNQMGADIVIHSIHKTLPSLTQTALLHMNGNLIDRERIKKYLSMLQSSSPSYLLLAGIDNCISLMEDPDFKEQVKDYGIRLASLRAKLKNMKHLELVESGRYDYSKIVISTKNTSMESSALMYIMRTIYKLELEMDGGTYVVAMTTVADTQEGLHRLERALLEIDEQLEQAHFLRVNQAENFSLDDIDVQQRLFHFSKGENDENDRYIDNIAELFRKLNEGAILSGKGDISDSSYYMYPPGIPIILPGEEITQGHLDLMNQLKDKGYRVHKK